MNTKYIATESAVMCEVIAKKQVCLRQTESERTGSGHKCEDRHWPWVRGQALAMSVHNKFQVFIPVTAVIVCNASVYVNRLFGQFFTPRKQSIKFGPWAVSNDAEVNWRKFGLRHYQVTYEWLMSYFSFGSIVFSFHRHTQANTLSRHCFSYLDCRIRLSWK